MALLKNNRVLITGISGSGGSYLAEYISANHPEIVIHGISRWRSTTKDNLQAIRDKVHIHECDLNDFGSVFSVLESVQPSGIFHLASHANVRTSFITPHAVLSNNILGTSNLFEAIRVCNFDPVIQHCSTSEVYGQVAPEEVPITEDASLRPTSPYAVSKVTQDLLGLSYFKSYQMKIIRTRMFSYFNPRRTDLFATSFARQVARIEAGLQDELLHGNLDSVRTIIDVRDAMHAYWLALTCCEPGEVYNIGGQNTVSVGEFLNYLCSLATTNISTKADPKLIRPADVTLQIPNTNKFTEKTNWQPKYDFKGSVQHLLSYWRKKVKQELNLFV